MSSYNFQAQQIIHPSTILPEVIVQQAQRSGFQSILGGESVQTRIKEGDKYIYFRGLQYNLNGTAVTQGTTTNLPSAEFTTSLDGTPVYLFRTGAVFDHHDERAANSNGIALPTALDLAAEQTFARQFENICLNGIAGQGGVLDMITHITVAADSDGNTTVSDYIPGELAINVLANNIAALASNMFMLGTPLRCSVLLPQRILQKLQVNGVVALFSYQLVGGGTATAGQLTQQVCENVNIRVDFSVTDTLKGAGAGGKDIIVISIPEIETADAVGDYNTNALASLMPNQKMNNVQFCDRPKPTKIVSPAPQGKTDVLYELFATAGVALRPEASVALEMAYS